MLRNRGISATGYGLLVGLIGVAALAALQASGSSVSDIFDRSNDALTRAGLTGSDQPPNTAETTPTATPTATPSPTPSPTPTPDVTQLVCGGSLILTGSIAASDGGTFYLCQFGRTSTSQRAIAETIAHGCLSSVSELSGSTMTPAGSAGTFPIGAFRYETPPFLHEIYNPGIPSDTGEIRDCTNSTCTGTEFGNNWTTFGGIQGVVVDDGLDLCNVSLDSFNMTGSEASRSTSYTQELDGINLGGRGVIAQTVTGLPLARYDVTRGRLNGGHTLNISARSQGFILQYIAP